jgi:hypothetical protein
MNHAEPGTESVAPLLRGLSLVASGLTALWALGGLAAALLTPSGAWFTAGFESILFLAALATLLVALRRHPGLAMALACTAGTLIVGSGLGYVAAGGELLGTAMRPWLLARLGWAVILGTLAAIVLLSRDPRASLPPLLWSIGLALPLGLLGLLALRGIGAAQLAALPGMVRLSVLFALFVLTLGLIAGSVHQLMRAFSPPSATR